MSRWCAAYLLRCRDVERTEYAQRKAGRGIRLVRIRGVSVIGRTVKNEVLPITNYQISRFAR